MMKDASPMLRAVVAFFVAAIVAGAILHFVFKSDASIGGSIGAGIGSALAVYFTSRQTASAE